MDRWIRSFLKIKQNHADPSDYEKFFTSSRNYLAKNPSCHSEVSKTLVEALATFKNVQLLSMAYRLLCCVSVELEIPESTLKRHFKNSYLREYMFPLVSKLGLRLFDSILLRLLHKPHYECKSFFDLMKSRRGWALEFLCLESRELARKQMMLMVHTGMFHNLDYFITFFGSRDRSLSFLAFETFMLFMEELVLIERNGKQEGKEWPAMVHKGASFSVWCNLEDAWISLEPCLEVESPSNFLIHFIDFMCEKEKLRKLIAAGNRNEVEAILKRYVDLKEPVSIPSSRWISTSPRRVALSKEEEDVEDTCFEYLFSGRTYKDAADCIEI